MTKKGKKDFELEFIYNELFDKMVELVIRYDEPQIVASTMMAQAIGWLMVSTDTLRIRAMPQRRCHARFAMAH